MKSAEERRSDWPLIIGITIAVLGLTAGPALAALSFSGTSISGDGAVVIDSSSTISIGTSTATGVTIGNGGSAVSLLGNVGVGRSTDLATLAVQPPAPFVISSCTTTANGAGDIVGVGTGCQFTKHIGVGAQIALSSDPATLGTVVSITSDNDLQLDSADNGDSLGDGTSQTITVYGGAQTIWNSSGLPTLTITANGRIGGAFGEAVFNNGSGTLTYTDPQTYMFLQGVLTPAIESSNAGTLYMQQTVLATDASDATNHSQMKNILSYVLHRGSGVVTNEYGNYDYVGTNGGSAGTVTNAYGYYYLPTTLGGGTVTNAFASYAGPSNGSGVTNYKGFYCDIGTMSTLGVCFWSEDLSTDGAANSYYSWFDSRGVRRVKEDNHFNGVGQAIEALYNPQFTKYTPGATDYERLILGEWNSNVAEIGTENAGTGSSRALAFITASTTRMTIGATGNVGIGTAVPSTTLQVAGSSTIRIGAGPIPGCLELMDNSGNGTVNYLTATGGVLSATTTKPSACQ